MVQKSGFTAAALALSTACSRTTNNNGTSFADFDAVETAAKIQSGEISASEAVEAAIDRAIVTNHKINAIVVNTFDEAREAVKGAKGIMGGVPTFMKDLDDLVGVPTGFGSRAFPGYKGQRQVPLIDKFLEMGVVSLGKSTTPEFGLSATTESLSTNATRNPWNTDYSTGGSSGGAAALVASGVVPIAHASDGGGSIRIPASCCGNVGLKVSNGRFPDARPNNVGPIDLSVHGVQSRTVRDTAAVFAALEEPPAGVVLPPVGLVTNPSSERLKIGFIVKGLGRHGVDTDVVEATLRVAKLCEELGHQVEEIELELNPSFEDDFLLYWAAFANSAVEIWEERSGLPRNGFAFEPLTLGLAKLFKDKQATLEGALVRLQSLEALVQAQAFSKVDVVLSPVLATPPPRIGYLGGGVDYDTIIERLTAYVQFTALYNITGAPAISLPLSMSSSGLPIGSMFGAPTGNEKTLLELAYELEEADPWRGRRPAVFG